MSAMRQTRGKSLTTLTAKELTSKWDATHSDDELVSSMSQHKNELRKFLTEGEFDEKCFSSFVRNVTSASQASEKREEFEGILRILCESPFLTQHAMINTTAIHDTIGWEECQSVIKDTTGILTTILTWLPQFALKVMVAASQLSLVVSKMDTLPDRDRLLNSLASILQEAKTRQGSGEKVVHRNNGVMQYKDTDTPPENFIEISVVPTMSELMDEKTTFLRRNVVKGPYVDVEHYLDVHFRLMRLDFMIPLKNGLKKLMAKKDLSEFRCSDIRLYHNVKIVQTSFQNGCNHLVEFDASRCQRVDWESTDRLMNGSLVCLSKDCFKTVIIATVARRKIEDLQAGRVEINLKDGLELLLQCNVSDEFILAESTTFYDPYFHVLEGLKTMKGKFPFQNVLIHCKSSLNPPAYILSRSRAVKVPHYDFSCLMRLKEETLLPVLTTVKWPKASAMCLNESQRDAAILALTKEVCVIQGPPGTGKTYVGLKVVEALLKNKRGFTCSPILIVCYTNHALDQFLEGITKFCPKDIVRIGGGCKTESLQQFNLNRLKGKHTISVSKEKKQIEGEIHRLHCILSSLRTKIQSTDILQQFMIKDHYESLKKTSCELSSWLNAPSGAPQDEIPKLIQLALKKLALQWQYTCSEKGKPCKEMNILDRCAIYYSKVKKVRERLNTEIHFARRDGKASVESEMKRLITLSYSDILPDDIFDKYLQKSFAMDLRQIFDQGIIDAKNIIEYWLLGQHRPLRGQLQDIEVLSRHLKEVNGVMASGNAEFTLVSNISHGYGDNEQGDLSFKTTVLAGSENEDLLYVIHQVDKLKLDVFQELLTRSGTRPSTDVGWQNVGYNSVFSFSKVIRTLLSTQPMTEKEEKNFLDIRKLNIKQRYALYMLWLRRYEDHLIDKLKLALEGLNNEVRLEKDAENEQTATLLKQRQIIGMTTTGAAKYKSLLEKVGCSVVVVEEAAEVLESHVITALNENCQHLILIGDHQQLRPKPATYELERNFGLDVSLFERLIKNNIPHVTLKIQHRMRPEVSQIIKLIYPGLEDHPSVCEYDHIRGVSKDVFFINHSHQETRSSDNFSKSNLFEAEFSVALCQYLLKQDYKPTQVTILATYKGQVTLIKKCLGDLKDTVRVSAVDDFQGEENEIIILSFVRSNEENIAGFVKIDNRVCVALSRAKKGFFVLGNFDFLASKSKLWKSIIYTAEKNEIIGRGLPVQCHNHPKSVQLVSTAEEFSTRPEGGCGSPCMFLLKCGHHCQLRCHGSDALHEKYICRLPCRESCEEGHPCSLMCYEVCQCPVPVTKTLTKCGHRVEIPCFLSPDRATCPEKCLKSLPCGHLCQGMCKNCALLGVHENCKVDVTYTFQPCGHVGQVPCCKSQMQVPCEVVVLKKLQCGHKKSIPCHMSPGDAKCSEQCSATLPCGHSCEGQCCDCRDKKKHRVCHVTVDYTYQPCGHAGKEPCHFTKEQGICPNECSVKLPCGHPCLGKCCNCVRDEKHEDCLVGVEYIHPSCGHSSRVQCYKTFTNILCLEPCTSRLKCGHTCKGTCSDCLGGLVHQVCDEYCHLSLPCGHTCQGYCSTPCLPCELPCPFKCKHRTCGKKMRRTLHQMFKQVHEEVCTFVESKTLFRKMG